jgi:hypothetical protein
MLGIVPRKLRSAVSDLMTRLHGAQGHQQAAGTLLNQLQSTGDIYSPSGQKALAELVAHHVAAGKALRAALSCAELSGAADSRRADELRQQWLSAAGHMEPH